MRLVIPTLIILLAAGGCARAAETPAPAFETSAPSPSPPKVEETAAVKAQTPPQAPEPAPAGLLVEMRAASHPGYDRLVLEFGGEKAPPHQMRFVDEVRQDPSDMLVPLRGTRFLLIVFDGATLDTTRWEMDAGKSRRYTGPDRISPDLALLKQVAIAGDFEAVLSFGVGLSRDVKLDVQVLSAPARLVIDFR